jgi:endonuclease YncB( thermonuclease family)
MLRRLAVPCAIVLALLMCVAYALVAQRSSDRAFVSSRVVAPQSFDARVIRVSDGDSITVRAGETNTAVRLADIDAPERGQPWGRQSRLQLADLVAGKTVRIMPVEHDRYGRLVAKVEASGVAVNREMVHRGAAWAYRRYLRDRSLLGVERAARGRSEGLWALPEAERVPPWEHRRLQREEAKARKALNTPAVGR